MKKVHTPTKVKRQKKIRKLIMACGFQKNEIDKTISLYLPLYPEYEDFINFLKGEVESYKNKCLMERALRSFSLETRQCDEYINKIYVENNKDTKEAFIVKKTLEEVKG